MSAARNGLIPRAGETFVTANGDRILVRRVARDGTWADVVVTQLHGASWNKRQPLLCGAFMVPCEKVEGPQ